MSGAALLLASATPRAMADRLVEVVGPDATRGVQLREPFGIGFDQDDNMWVIEMVSGNRLLRLDRAGVLRPFTEVTDRGFAGDGGPAATVQFNGPHSLVVLPDGNVLVGDTHNDRVRKVRVSPGVVESLPGYGATAEPPVKSAPYCISLYPSGDALLIADLSRVWHYDLKSHRLRVVAGNGKKGVPQDGSLATESPLVDPRAAAADRLGNIYILERNGHALRRVDADGRIFTVVNASGRKGFAGDGGPALDALMSGPKHLCVDRDNTVIIADAENHVIRRYRPKDEVIERIAGTGEKGAAGLEGEPAQAQLNRPHGVEVHPSTGELYIVDSYNDRILKVVEN